MLIQKVFLINYCGLGLDNEKISLLGTMFCQLYINIVVNLKLSIKYTVNSH
jgi:hypothetical protein